MALVTALYRTSNTANVNGISISYDGFSLWIVRTDYTIIRLRESDGAYLKLDGTVGTLNEAIWTPATTGAMWAMADPDGIHIWVQHEFTGIARLIRYVIATGIADFTYAAVESGGILVEQFTSPPAYDGTYFWVLACQISAPGQPTNLYRWPIDVTHTVEVAKYSAFGSYTYAILWDGVNLWASDSSGTIMKRSPSDPVTPLTLAHTITTNFTSTPFATDGTIIWIIQTSPTPGILRVRVSDGAYLKPDLSVTSVLSEALAPFTGSNGTDNAIIWDPVTQAVWNIDKTVLNFVDKYPYPGINVGQIVYLSAYQTGVDGITASNGPIWVNLYYTVDHTGFVAAITSGDVSILAQLSELISPITDVTMLAQNVEFVSQGNEMFAQTAEFPTYKLNIYGNGLTNVTGLQFMPFGPTSGTPTSTPSGPSVPIIPLVPPDFIIVNDLHIGVPDNTTQNLLSANVMYYDTWYKAYLTYTCGEPPPPVPTARAINPDHGWNWDPVYVIAPDISTAVVTTKFTAPLTRWATISTGSVTPSSYGLVLSAGPGPATDAGIISLDSYPQGDFTIDFNINRPSSSDTFADVFTYAAMDYVFNTTGWYVSVTREYRPNTGHVYAAYIVTPTDSYGGFVLTNSWSGSLRIIRYKQSITLLAKDFGADRWLTVAYTRVAPMDDVGNIVIYTTNGNVPQIASSTISIFTARPGVMFGLETAVYTEIGPSIINLLVQPQLDDTIRFVTITTYTPSMVLRETFNGFEYIRPNKFKIGGPPAGDWWIYRDVPTQPDIEYNDVQPTSGTRLLNTTLTPSIGRYEVGQSIQYRVIAKFNDNTTRDITNMCTWATTDSDGILSHSGLMHYGSIPGIYYVTATYKGLTQTAVAYTSISIRFASIATLG